MAICKDRRHCLICGFDFQDRIFPEDFCSCCGATQGYFQDDDDPDHIKNYRKHWFDKGAPWHGKLSRPKVWNKELALEQIKKNVPEKFQ